MATLALDPNQAQAPTLPEFTPDASLRKPAGVPGAPSPTAPAAKPALNPSEDEGFTGFLNQHGNALGGALHPVTKTFFGGPFKGMTPGQAREHLRGMYDRGETPSAAGASPNNRPMGLTPQAGWDKMFGGSSAAKPVAAAPQTAAARISPASPAPAVPKADPSFGVSSGAQYAGGPSAAPLEGTNLTVPSNAATVVSGKYGGGFSTPGGSKTARAPYIGDETGDRTSEFQRKKLSPAVA